MDPNLGLRIDQVGSDQLPADHGCAVEGGLVLRDDRHRLRTGLADVQRHDLQPWSALVGDEGEDRPAVADIAIIIVEAGNDHTRLGARLRQVDQRDFIPLVGPARRGGDQPFAVVANLTRIVELGLGRS